MSEEVAAQKIEEYSKAKQDYEDWVRVYTERRESILAYVKDDLEALDAEMKHYLDTSKAVMVTALDEAKAAVLDEQKTVKAAGFQFVFSQGRTTWDGAKLNGMAALIPQLNEAKRVGEPSVSVREG